MNNNELTFSPQAIDFYGFSKGQKIKKPEVMGQKLWNKLFERDPKFGGVTAAFYGVPGSGKTSLMLRVTKKNIEMHPEELIFWYEPIGVPIQTLNLGLPVNIFFDSGRPIVIRELTQKGPVDTDEIKARSFQYPNELIKLVVPGEINLVYFKDRLGWLRLINKMKQNLSWESFYLDEAEDIFPARCGGKDWHLNETFAGSIKEMRKARISMYLNSQCDWDCDPRIKSKLMLECYLYGSKKNENSPLFRPVLQDIELGEAWIVYANSQFGKIKFLPIEPKEKQYIALPRKRSDK